MSASLRTATDGDIDRLAGLLATGHDLLGTQPRPRLDSGWLRGLLTQPRWRVLLAEDADRLLGAAVLDASSCWTRLPSAARLEALVIAPETPAGVAETLVRALDRQAALLRCTTLVVSGSVGTELARRLGFDHRLEGWSVRQQAWGDDSAPLAERFLRVAALAAANHATG
ncbi:GNAT family N-acetyltransferase, partial [Frankia sp. CcWB2]